MTRIIQLALLVVRRPRSALRFIKYKFQSFNGTKEFIPFVILSRARSGSNLLRAYLNSVDGVRVEAEILNWKRGRDVTNVVHKAYGKQPKNIKAKGFKLFYYHPNDGVSETVWDELTTYENIIIFDLVRENLLDIVVSRELAELTDQWIVGNDVTGRKIGGPKLKLDPSRVESLFKSMEAERKSCLEYLSARAIEIRYISYTQLVSDPVDVVTSLLTELELPQKFCVSDRRSPRKQNNRPISDIVVNYEEVREYFVGSDWEVFFSDAK